MGGLKSCPISKQCICHFGNDDPVHIIKDVLAKSRSIHMVQLNMISNHR